MATIEVSMQNILLLVTILKGYMNVIIIHTLYTIFSTIFSDMPLVVAYRAIYLQIYIQTLIMQCPCMYLAQKREDPQAV